MKLNKKFFIFLGGLLLAVAVLGLAIFAWQCHLKQEQVRKAEEEKETYESLNYYTGTFTIDDYSFLENGTGVAVHWKSENPEEDALVRKYATLKNADRPVQVTIGARNANYIVRENMKLPSGPNYLDKKNEDNYYTLSIYHVKNQQLEGYKEDLYKLVSDYNSKYLPRGIEETLTVIDGNNYLSILASESGEHEKFQTLWYNLDTRKIEWEDNKTAQFQSPTFNFKLNTQQFKEKLGNFRFPIIYPLGEAVDTSWIRNILMAQTDPKAAALLEKTNSQLYILDKSVKDYLEFYSLLVPSNTDLYEGVIPASISKDGLEHPFNSKEEFNQFYDESKDKELMKQKQNKSILQERVY